MSSVPWTYDARPDTRTTNVRMGVWLFLASEAMFFGSLFSAYVLLRTGAASWPGAESLHLSTALVHTALLAGASVAAMRGRLTVSSVFAAGFLVSKGLEYSDKLAAGLVPATNLLLACWFTLTFVHALHVAGGAGANLWAVLTRADAGSPGHTERLHALRLYWYFIDFVWLAILIAFYFV